MNQERKTIRAAVIGHPIAHSKSPIIHTHWMNRHGIEGSYVALDVPPAELAATLRHLAAEGYTGFNLTLPHKEQALTLCDELSALAHAAGAVNTIAIHEGKLCGTNTDIFGFLENIRRNTHGFNFAQGPVVIIGAGGAARGVVHGLLEEGAPEIRIANRTVSAAEGLARLSPRIKIIPWDERTEALHEANLLVNTTSLGMAGEPELALDLGHLPQTAVVNDIVYTPLMTDLLQAASARGNPVVTGIGMLLHQARPAFREWCGILPDIDDALLQKVLS